MSVGKIRVELELDNGQFVQRVIRAGTTIQQLNTQLGHTVVGVERLEKNFSGLRTAVTEFTTTMALASSALNNLYQLTLGWGVGIVKTNAEIERMTFLLKGMSNASGEMAKWGQAEKNVSWIVDFATKAPFSINALTDTFVKFKAVGLDPTGGSMRSLVNAVAAFGGSEEIMKRATVSIQQMAGKGVISMEELRQQLGEAVPNAIPLLARSMNITVAKMVDIISKGQLEAKNALKSLFAEFERTFGGSAQQMMGSFTGLMQRLSTEWTKLQIVIGNGGANDGTDKGFFAAVKDQLAEIVTILQSSGVQSMAENFGATLKGIVVNLREVVATFWRWRDTIVAAGTALAAYFIGTRILGGLGLLWASFAQGGASIRNFVIDIQALSARWGLLMIAMRSGAGATATVNVALSALTATVTGLGRAFMALAGPIGIAMGLLYTLAERFDLFGTQAEAAFKKVAKGQSLLDQVDLTNAMKGLAAAQEQLRLIDEGEKTAVEDAKTSAIMGANSFGPEDEIRAIEKYRAEMHEKRVQLETEIKKFQVHIDGAVRRLENDAVSTVATNMQSEVRERVNAIIDTYRSEQEVLSTELASLSGDDKEVEKKREEIKKKSEESRRKRHEDEITLLKAEIENYTAKSIQFRHDGMEQEAKAAIEVAFRLKEDLQNARQMLESGNLTGDMKLMSGKNKPEDRAGAIIARLKSRIADAQAEMAGGSGEAAKWKSLLGEEGLKSFEGISEGAEKQIIALAKALDAANTALSEHKKRMNDAAEASQSLSNLAAANNVQLGEMEERIANPNGPVFSDRIVNMEKQIAKYLDTVRAAGDATRAQLAEADATRALEYARQSEAAKFVLNLRDKSKSMRESLAETAQEEREIREKALQEEIERINIMVEQFRIGSEERVKAEQWAQEYIRLAREKIARDTEGPMEKMLRDWRDTTKNMQQATARWLDDFVDRSVEAFKTGKFEWKDMIESMLTDLAKLILRAQVANLAKIIMGDPNSGEGGAGGGGLLSGAQNWFSKLLGGNGTGTGTDPGFGKDIQWETPDIMTAHTGGVVGSELNRWFGPNGIAKRFHSGGFPGLRADEVPIIARKGEGVFTPEQMKAMGGRGANVQVNVINQSGQQLSAEQGQPRFDGEKTVLDIVVRNINRPGPFRDAMKGAVA